MIFATQRSQCEAVQMRYLLQMEMQLEGPCASVNNLIESIVRKHISVLIHQRDRAVKNIARNLLTSKLIDKIMREVEEI